VRVAPAGAASLERVEAGFSGRAFAPHRRDTYVIGITLKLWPQDCVNRAEDKCCGPQAVMDARSVCHKLGIPYYLIDESEDFHREVIRYFAEEYKAGRTPNPCVQ